jgi:6-phosphofructokinase 1
MDEYAIQTADFEIARLGEPKFADIASEKHGQFMTEANQIVFPIHSNHLQSYLAANKPIPTMELAGPRAKLFFNPTKTKIGIVTCGGLCPGINTIIRSIVMTAAQFYGISTMYGFRNGYQGLNPACKLMPMMLTPDLVDNIHEEGGTILGSSRGEQPIPTMVDYLQSLEINILFVVGGDGTMRGGRALAQEIHRRKLPISIIGIPKTIDNDIAFIERSFGFETATEEATKAIYSAHTESKGAPNGIGIVKLMGRESGFIACYASLSSAVANYCLIPEVPFSFEKLLPSLERRIKNRNHAVIVVAEGAGQELFAQEPEQYDASGNKKLHDIGDLLKGKIKAYFKNIPMEVNVKYIDPGYMIRSVPANGDDNVFCLILAHNAVHAGMSGRTEMVVGYRNDHFVHLPMKLITSERKKVNPNSRLWKTVLDTTRQPAELI